jgi:hypothetical protein
MEAHLRIGTWFGLGVGVMLGMMAGATAARQWPADGLLCLTPELFRQDGKVAEQAARVQAGTLGLQRDAKAILLSTHAPAEAAASQTQWAERLATQRARVDALAQQAIRTQEQRLVAAMRQELAAYEAGFAKLLHGIQQGMLTPPPGGLRVRQAGLQTRQL